MTNIIDKIKNKAALKLYNEARSMYLKKSICNIGRIVETDDKIICYVEQDALDKYKGNKPIYGINLKGMNQGVDKETVEAFGLNKPVYYVFDGINFSSALRFSSTWCDVIFKNCTFDKNIGIIWGREITLENNKYKDSCDVYFYGDCFLTAGTVKKLTFINETFVNSSLLAKYPYNDTVFGMKIQAGEVEFIDSTIVCQNDGGVSINAKKTKLENSAFIGQNIIIESESIESNNTSITAKKIFSIENSSRDFDGEVKASRVVYNGVVLSTNGEKINVNEYNSKLIQARRKLVQELKRIRDYCLNINEEKVQKVRDELNSDAISKVLRK